MHVKALLVPSRDYQRRGVHAPAGDLKPIVAEPNAGIVRIVCDPEVKERRA